ncbi:HAMP domain-containing histidine kinase [Halobacillus fulvus]|nr:HAMP domain-containing histidine kinase [Halobacillus fulvus]
MILHYLKERLSWILFILCLQMFLIIFAFIDPSIALSSMIYYVFLTLLSFLVFLFFRYQKESFFFKQLKNRNTELDFTSIPDPGSPFEELVADNLTEEIDRLRKEASGIQQQSEQEMDELLAWIHEVKTPLSTIRLIIDRIEDQKLRQQLTYEWLRVHLLLDQKLHQKRIHFLENDLYIEQVDLRSLLIPEIKSLQSWCMEKGIGFDMELNVPHVLSDAKWLAFILRQLLTNAVKYSENSDIKIIAYEKHGRTHVILQDEGRGIEAQDLPRIFEKGFTSTVHHHDGRATGMGLYLVKNAATALKIEIDVRSASRRGTSVTLTFPDRNTFTDLRSM